MTRIRLAQELAHSKGCRQVLATLGLVAVLFVQPSTVRAQAASPPNQAAPERFAQASRVLDLDSAGDYARLSAKPTGGEHSTGLGLSIVKKMVEAMNGKVWCESELGKGATFVVQFPTTPV